MTKLVIEVIKILASERKSVLFLAVKLASIVHMLRMESTTINMADSKTKLIRELFRVNAIKFGEFKLKSGILSPIYVNLRVIISYPKLLRDISELLWCSAFEKGSSFDVICGVPYTALPIATCISLDHSIPMVLRRREMKDHGTRVMIEGEHSAGQVCLVVEDVVSSGGSVYETVTELEKVGLKVIDAVVLIDREQGGCENLSKNGIKLHSVIKISEMMSVLLQDGCIDQSMFDQVHEFIIQNQFTNKPLKVCSKILSYDERSSMTQNPVAKRIFQLMEMKKSNLAFSADVTCCAELLRLADMLGPHICILKTHVDILTDFTEEFVVTLKALSEKHKFVIFEDRKFADIGSTVKNQFTQGIYQICNWAELINAHTLPGEGVILGLKEASMDRDRACLLIAQMSSCGSLTNSSYQKSTLDIAKKFPEFVIGFICTSKICDDDPGFLHMVPGVSLSTTADSLGQQYLTPSVVIGERQCDVIIVGRGIYKAENPVDEAIKYKIEGYKAYLNRLTAA